MSASPSGRLVVLSGPSGVGKDTVIAAWRERNPLVERVVAYTTRAPRPGEAEGVDYHFVSDDDFLDMAAAGEFLEHKEVHGNRYATPKADVDRLLSGGKVALLKVDVQGGLAVMSLRDDAISVFLFPPDADELERRLRARGTEDNATLVRRLQNAVAEMALATQYRHRVVNDDVGRVVDELQRIVS